MGLRIRCDLGVGLEGYREGVWIMLSLRFLVFDAYFDRRDISAYLGKLFV